MKVGLISPLVHLLPGTPGWERDAEPDALRRVARHADELGFAYMTCSEHVGIPHADVKIRGPRFYDPVATLGFLAAATVRIKLLSHIVVVPYHHPLALLKRYGTVNTLSGGRLILGCGVGSLRAEFELLGAPFEGRGAVYDERLNKLRESFDKTEVDGFVIDPPLTRVPMWLGGRSKRSLRRALDIADGWVPFGHDVAGYRALIGEPRAGFDYVLPLLWEEQSIAELSAELAALSGIGATFVSLTLRARSQTHYLERLASFAEAFDMDAEVPG